MPPSPAKFFIFCLLVKLLCVSTWGRPPSNANWCRHVSLVSRSLERSSKSTACYIPDLATDLKSINLRNTINGEWQWALNHSRTVDGQLFVVGENSVTLLTQKVCLDAGNDTAHPVRILYENVESGSSPIGLIGDFNARQWSGGDIYRSCTENEVTWRDFIFKRSIRDKGTPLSDTATQYMTVHERSRSRKGLGIEIIPFDLNYSTEQLESTFQTALKQAARRDKYPEKRERDIIETGKPTLLNRLPFLTGHIVIATNATAGEHKDILNDITSVAQNRLLEAVASLTGIPSPPDMLSKRSKWGDIFLAFLVAQTVIISFHQNMSSAASKMRENVKKWAPPRCVPQIDDWTLVRTASDHCHLVNYPAPLSQSIYASVVVALWTIFIPVYAFVFSNSYHNIVVHQGGLVTYGPSNITHWSYDLDNGYAGAIFVVGHWYRAQIVEVSTRGTSLGMLCGTYLVAAVLAVIFYKFATFPEGKEFRPSVIRAILQAILGALVRISPSGRGFRFISSYRSTYIGLVHDLAKKHSLTMNAVVSFSKRWDGVLNPPPRRSRPVLTRSTVNSLDEWPQRLNGVPLSEDEVEKASAFLASSRFGPLSYPQAIALLSCPRLLRKADRLRKRGGVARGRDIRGFAKLFYVTGVLLPEKLESMEASTYSFRIFGIMNETEGGLQTHENFVMLLALPPDQQGETLEEHGIAV